MPVEFTANQLFRLLADDTRLSATLLIRQEGELCVCELTAALDISQPKISRHLAQLRSGGLLADKRRGQWVYYSLAEGLPPWAIAILDAALSANYSRITCCALQLKTMINRPTCC